MAAWHRACALAELSAEKPLGVEVHGRSIGLFLHEGRCYALEDVCSHAFAPLSSGWVIDGAVECPLHGARFDLQTGACTNLPRHDDVPVYEVRLEADAVLVKID